jgi:hypothetical protein
MRKAAIRTPEIEEWLKAEINVSELMSSHDETSFDFLQSPEFVEAFHNAEVARANAVNSVGGEHKFHEHDYFL